MVKVEACERAAIGWNESTEASRAIAMTLPWLTSMSAVTIISSKKREAGADTLVEYLSWHGIISNAVFLNSKGNSVGEAMLNVCAEQQARLLVVGGFSHARRPRTSVQRSHPTPAGALEHTDAHGALTVIL
jgi:hypothetical protein